MDTGTVVVAGVCVGAVLYWAGRNAKPSSPVLPQQPTVITVEKEVPKIVEKTVVKEVPRVEVRTVYVDRQKPEPPAPVASQAKVGFNRKSKKYHRQGCQYFAGRLSLMTEAQAIAKGGSPCPWCPPA